MNMQAALRYGKFYVVCKIKRNYGPLICWMQLMSNPSAAKRGVTIIRHLSRPRGIARKAVVGTTAVAKPNRSILS